jgi:dihydroorotate dehydrogenase
MFFASPETAHEVAKWFFKRSFLWKLVSWQLCVQDPKLHVRLGKFDLANPVGLAAGFDKNCEMVDALFRTGFGYLTLGTVTLNPRDGNPKPRIWRCPPNALINSMGLPNKGARIIATTLARKRPAYGPVIVSISGLSVEEFTECFRLVEPLVDGVELNISTPNTTGVRIFQTPETLTTLLKAIDGSKTSDKPVWVKLPPHFDDEGRENVHRLIDVCAHATVQGLTCVNTRLVNEPRASIGTGGLSGPPVFEDMLRIVADTYNYTNGRIPINACGGISSGLDAWKAFAAGASSVQLYTALVYHGPGIASRINRELLRLLAEAKADSINEVVGTGSRTQAKQPGT